MTDVVKKIPIALGGVCLALATLGNLVGRYQIGLRAVCGILSVVLFLLVCARLLMDGASVKKELENPVALSLFPTIAMTLMLLATYAKPFSGKIAFLVWCAGLASHMGILFLFVKRHVLSFQIKNVLPSWFVLVAGILVGSITSPVVGMKEFGKVLFCVGVVLYGILIPFVVRRLFQANTFPAPARPTLAIVTAPMSLCLVAYLACFEETSQIVVYSLLVGVLVGYSYVCAQIYSLIRMEFYPTIAALTFPFAISAVAIRNANNFLVARGFLFLRWFSILTEIFAISIICYVLFRFARFFMGKETQEKSQ